MTTACNFIVEDAPGLELLGKPLPGLTRRHACRHVVLPRTTIGLKSVSKQELGHAVGIRMRACPELR